jgi:hypothetical protein
VQVVDEQLDGGFCNGTPLGTSKIGRSSSRARGEVHIAICLLLPSLQELLHDVRQVERVPPCTGGYCASVFRCSSTNSTIGSNSRDTRCIRWLYESLLSSSARTPLES